MRQNRCRLGDEMLTLGSSNLFPGQQTSCEMGTVHPRQLAGLGVLGVGWREDGGERCWLILLPPT